MTKLYMLALCTFLTIAAHAQDKKAVKKEPVRADLPSLASCIIAAQGNMVLYTQNLKDHSQEHDVNSIILDIEKYMDSMHKVQTYGDQLLIKYFNPLRHFFLTTENKTTVAAMFLYANTPYAFCQLGDTATALYIGAVKDGSLYNLSKTTENRIMRLSFENCLLPSLKALDEFKDEPKYVALSVYLGCKDPREGAPANAVSVFCLTFVARTADIQQYAAGLITAKGLLANAEIYISDEQSAGSLRKMQINVE